jgi:hypothetical protein
MKLTNNLTNSEENFGTFINSMSQGFEGESFYGLEYVLDDFLENSKKKAPALTSPADFDWFGLNG